MATQFKVQRDVTSVPTYAIEIPDDVSEFTVTGGGPEVVQAVPANAKVAIIGGTDHYKVGKATGTGMLNFSQVVVDGLPNLYFNATNTCDVTIGWYFNV